MRARYFHVFRRVSTLCLQRRR